MRTLYCMGSSYKINVNVFLKYIIKDNKQMVSRKHNRVGKKLNYRTNEKSIYFNDSDCIICKL